MSESKSAALYAMIARRDVEITTLRATVARLETEKAGLREAFKPFVAHWAPWMDEHPAGDTMHVAALVTFGQLRTARAALAAQSRRAPEPAKE